MSASELTEAKASSANLNFLKKGTKMQQKLFRQSAIMLSLMLMAAVSPSFAQSNPVFVQLGQAKGAVYKPDSGPQLQSVF
jgi:hypothetical protein